MKSIAGVLCGIQKWEESPCSVCQAATVKTWRNKCVASGTRRECSCEFMGRRARIVRDTEMNLSLAGSSLARNSDV